MQAVLVRYPFGIPISLVKEMADDCEVITIVNNPTEKETVFTQYENNGVNTDNCAFIYAASDSYWTRDYGPWYVFDGNKQPGIVNFPYNRPRPNDNDIPIEMAEYLDIDLYGMNLEHTGGNYMTDGMGKSSSTDLVLEENPTLSQEDIDSLVFHYLGIENYYLRPDPLDDYIKHIDCWGKFLSPGKVIIGQVPETDYRYEDYEAAANFFKNTISAYGKPYEVFRVMTPGGSPTTAYTNSLILNNKVFVPISGSSWDDEGLEAYEEAMPGYEIIGIIYSGWENTDALHCRTKGVADLGMLYIDHVPLLGTVGLNESYEITADFIAYSGEDVYEDSTFIYYSVNGGGYTSVLMEYEGDDTWTGEITGLGPGDQVDYYLYVADESGRHAMHPYIGEPDPHEFNVFGILTDDLALEPDTLLYETIDDCIDGLPLHIINISNDSVEITYITPGSSDEGFWWEVEELPVLPIKIGKDDSITLNVWIGIPVNLLGEYLQDTLFVETEDDSFSSLIIVDSDLVSNIEDSDSRIQLEVYPNPFHSQLRFDYDLSQNQEVTLSLYDLSGKVIYMEQARYSIGQQSMIIDASNIGIKPGSYIYQIRFEKEAKTGKVIFKP
jgi:agmatine/peptidylarginine deiminase